MAAETKTVLVMVKLVIKAEEEQSVTKIINECDHDFRSNMDGAEIEETEILRFWMQSAAEHNPLKAILNG